MFNTINDWKHRVIHRIIHATYGNLSGKPELILYSYNHCAHAARGINWSMK